MVDAAHIRRAGDLCSAFLDEQLDVDWTRRVPDLDLSIAEVVAHMAESCLWYAIDLAAGGADLDPVEHRVDPTGNPVALVATLRAHASVVAAVVESAPETARGFHPMGSADASGFAAMACDEMLIHTDDVARALDVEFRPPVDLADRVLHRLFPWCSDSSDGWQTLRWANGRIAHDGRTRLNGWAWHCSPISEWDGSVAVRPSSSRAVEP